MSDTSATAVDPSASTERFVRSALADRWDPAAIDLEPDRAVVADLDRVEFTRLRGLLAQFGASEHVATTVLAAMAVDGSRRGAVNLATDDALLDAAAARGLDRLEFEAGYEGRGERLVEQFEERGSVPDVLFHRGAFGIEPITYVFGETGADAARLAAELVADAVEQ